jgi:quercetin dioxygenase-like cupin family protein
LLDFTNSPDVIWMWSGTTYGRGLVLSAEDPNAPRVSVGVSGDVVGAGASTMSVVGVRTPASTGRRPDEEDDTMSEERVGPQTSGVAVELLASVDLGAEIAGLDGHELRMRRISIEPGGVFGPRHDHVGRPGTVFVLQGTITDHRDGVDTDYGPGVGWPEDRNTVHWLENRGTVTAVEISVDVVRSEPRSATGS